MAFTHANTIVAGPTSAGTLQQGTHTVLSANKYVDGIAIGRFARIDATVGLTSFDGSATPKVAGVVLRDLGATLDTATYSKPITETVEYARVGMVVVEAVAGQTATIFDDIHINNVAGAEAGKARSDGTGVAANAEFIKLVATDVWLIRLK